MAAPWKAERLGGSPTRRSAAASAPATSRAAIMPANARCRRMSSSWASADCFSMAQIQNRVATFCSDTT